MLLESISTAIPIGEIITGIGLILTILITRGNAKLKKILAQTQTNGGSSLKDQMNRIEGHLEDLTLLVEAGHNLSPKPIFRTDESGRFTWVNTAFTRLVGMNLDELKGLGWITAIDKIDVQRVTIEWDAAIRDKRNFETTLLFNNTYSRDSKKVKIKAHPILKKNSVLGYLGTVFILEEIVDIDLH